MADGGDDSTFAALRASLKNKTPRGEQRMRHRKLCHVPALSAIGPGTPVV